MLKKLTKEMLEISTYIWMKILESTPSRYDKGIRILTLGKLDTIYDRLTSHIKKEQKVLDIGCGTGALTLRAAKKGAKVKGIDINPQMLEIAQKRVTMEELTQKVELYEMGVAELGNEETNSYDVVMSGLCLSELTEDELTYTLEEVKRILTPSGLILIADEVVSKNISKRLFIWLIRIPLVVITYIITQTATHGVKKLPEKLRKMGFVLEYIRTNKMGDFMELVGRNSKKE